MPGLRSPDIPAWKIALKGGDLNPLQNMLRCTKFNEKEGGFDAKNTASANFVKNLLCLLYYSVR
jgi:hypothetical protein